MELAGADVLVIRTAVDLDQLAVDRGLLVRHHLLEVALLVLVPQRVGAVLDALEYLVRDGRCAERAVVDLLEVRLALVDLARGDVERNRGVGESERIHPSVELVRVALHALRVLRDLAELERRVAVDHLDDARVRGLRGGQHGVHGEPVVVRAEVSARRPLVYAPAAALGLSVELVFVELVVFGPHPRILRALLVVPARSARDDHLRSARLLRGGGGEAPLVHVGAVDERGGSVAEYGLDLRRPAEVLVPEERIVALHGGEVVSIRVAVSLRIHRGRVVDVRKAVLVSLEVGDAVVERVCDLSAHDVAREVPDEAVVVRRGPRLDEVLRGIRVVVAHVASPEEAQLLVEKVLAHVHEREDRAFRAVIDRGGVAEVDGRVHRVRERLVSEHHVQLGDASRGHLKRERERAERLVGLSAVDRQLLRLVEDRLVELDEPVLVQRVLVERNVAFIRRARLLHHGELRVERSRRCHLGVVLAALLERVDRLEDALDPALEELRLAPVGPLVADKGYHARILRTVPARDVVVGKPEHAFVADGDPVLQGRAGLDLSGEVVPRGRVVRRQRRRAAVRQRIGVLPLELPQLRRSAEVGRVLHADLLVERILRLDRIDRAVPQFGDDAYDVHRYVLGLVRHDLEVRRVVHDERHISRSDAGRHERERIVHRVLVRYLDDVRRDGLDARLPVGVVSAREAFAVRHQLARTRVHDVEPQVRVDSDHLAVGAGELQLLGLSVRKVVLGHGIEHEALLHERRQMVEVALAGRVVEIPLDAVWYLLQRTGLPHGRVDELHASLARDALALLVGDPDGKLAAHLGKSVLRLVERLVDVELRDAVRPADDEGVVDSACVGSVAHRVRARRAEVSVVALHVVRKPHDRRSDFRRRHVVYVVEGWLVRIAELEHVVRDVPSVARLVRPETALAVLEARRLPFRRRTRYEAHQVRRLERGYRIRSLEHEPSLVELAEAVAVVLRHDAESSHTHASSRVRVVIGHENVRKRREALRLRVRVVDVAPKRIDHAIDHHRVLLVWIVARLRAVALTVDRRVLVEDQALARLEGRTAEETGRNEVAVIFRTEQEIAVVAVHRGVLKARADVPLLLVLVSWQRTLLAELDYEVRGSVADGVFRPVFAVAVVVDVLPRTLVRPHAEAGHVSGELVGAVVHHTVGVRTEQLHLSARERDAVRSRLRLVEHSDPHAVHVVAPLGVLSARDGEMELDRRAVLVAVCVDWIGKRSEVGDLDASDIKVRVQVKAEFDVRLCLAAPRERRPRYAEVAAGVVPFLKRKARLNGEVRRSLARNRGLRKVSDDKTFIYRA